MPVPTAGHDETSAFVQAPFAVRLVRLAPLVLVLLVTAGVIAMGWHRELSLETLIRNRMEIEAFVARHWIIALALFIGLYIGIVALSIPGAAILTISGGFIFGPVFAGVAVVVGATTGATVIFLVARTAVGEWLIARAGDVGKKLARGFRKNAFSYLLFLRLVPLFPFWLVNIVAALCGIGLGPYIAATALGIIPSTFAFALFGAGLDSAIAAQQATYQACLASRNAACQLDFDAASALTPQLIVALVALGVLALLPVAIKGWRASHARNTG